MELLYRWLKLLKNQRIKLSGDRPRHCFVSKTKQIRCKAMRFSNETNEITRRVADIVPDNNASRGEQHVSDAVHKAVVINCAVNIVLSLTSIIGNTLVLHSVWRTPTLRSPSMILLCGLAFSDLAVGAVAQPLFIANNLIALYLPSGGPIHVLLFLNIYNMLGFSLCGISLCTVAAISVDRLLAIQKSLQYPSLVTIPRVTRLLIAIWTACVILASTQLWHQKSLLILMGTVICVCLCISTISHVKIYKTVHHHRNAIQTQLQAVRSNTGSANMSGLKKCAFNAFIVFLVLIICYCPYLVVYVISSFYPINDFLAKSLASTVVFTNSSLNPFLYCWRLREIREAVLRTCRKLVCWK